MKVIFENDKAGWIYIHIETDTAEVKLRTSCLFNPFEDLFIWLGLIQSSVSTAHLVIYEEGCATQLSIIENDSGNHEFTIKYLHLIEPRPALLKQNHTSHEIFDAFYLGIINFLQNDRSMLNENQRHYYESFCNIQWDKLVDGKHALDYWLSRIRLLERNARVGTELSESSPLKLEDFSGGKKHIFSLWKSLHRISYSCGNNYRDVVSALSQSCADLTVDILLDDVNDEWHQKKIEQAQLDLSQRYREMEDKRREEYLAKRNARQRAEKIMNCLQVGSLIGGRIVKLNPRSVIVKMGELAVLLPKDEFSHQEFSEEETIFHIDDWVRAIVIYIDREKMRVAISTRHLEKNPGDMLKAPYLVYATADEMAEQYRRNLDE